MIVEVCANSYESAINAELGGANRIELCKDLHLDGLTPAYEISKKTIDILKIPVYILIRPFFLDFFINFIKFLGLFEKPIQSPLINTLQCIYLSNV